MVITEKTFILILALGLIMVGLADGLLLLDYNQLRFIPPLIQPQQTSEAPAFIGILSGKFFFWIAAKVEPFFIGFNKTTIILVGDIMLDRGVEWQIRKAGDWAYPFQNIAPFLSQADITIGNLEGPMVQDPPYFPDHSLQFAFSEKAIQGLKEADFNLLSLANNHTFNMGPEGLAETKQILRNSNISFAGDPISCSSDYAAEKKRVVFLSFNKTFSFNCSDEAIARIIKQTKQKNPNKFLIVMFHWGREYALKSSPEQRALAHKAVQSGANLIVGAHPHVVQEIEQYQGSLIFYSLGNFIFDQYFSEATQQGLAVKVGISPERIVYTLYPVQSRHSQPALMEYSAAQKFLQDLALKSQPQSQAFIQQIKTGRITIP